MFHRKSFLFCLFAAAQLLAFSVPAESGTEVFLNISKKFSQKIRIAVPYFTASGNSKSQAAKSSEVLSNDLLLSGYFEPVKERSFVEENQRDDLKKGKIDFQEWKRIGTDMVVKGTYRENGGQIQIGCSVFSVNDAREIFGKSYSGSASQRRSLIHRICDDIVKSLTGETGIAQTKAAFVMGSGRTKEICVMDYDGHNVKKITHDGAISLYPKWSKDGRRIVYTSFVNKKPQICLIDLSKNTRTVLSSSPGLNATASFSPSGDKIALTLSKDGNPEIYVKYLNDGYLRRVTNNRAVDSSPSWSPDGSEIVFVSNRSGSPQLYITDIYGENVRRLTYKGNYNTAPAWSPKGDLIAYASQMGREFQICTVNVSTGETDTITSDGRDNEDPSWAPDGRHIIYTSTKNYRPSIFIVDIYDRNPIKLPDIPGGALNPDWTK